MKKKNLKTRIRVAALQKRRAERMYREEVFRQFMELLGDIIFFVIFKAVKAFKVTEENLPVKLLMFPAIIIGLAVMRIYAGDDELTTTGFFMLIIGIMGLYAPMH